MSKPKPNLLLMLAVAIFATAVVFEIAYGSGDDVEVETEVVTGDISTRGGISVGGGDMEIADSLATHSILFGLWQGTHTNPYTEADKLEARGNYKAAAEMRCSTKKYKKVYGKDCIDSVITIPVEVPRETSVEDPRLDALYARISEMEVERVQDKANTEKAVKSAEAQAQRADMRAKRVQTQQQAPDEGKSRRALAREAYQKALKGEE